MSRLIVAPDWLASAAAEVQSIGSALSAANAAAAAPPPYWWPPPKTRYPQRPQRYSPTTAGSIRR